MQNNSSAIRWVFAGGLLFSLVFFNEKLAINLVLFDLFILAALFLQYAEARQNAAVRWFALGHLTSLAMLVLHNTVLSGVACVVTLVLAMAYTLYLHRSPWFAGASGIGNFVMSPYLFFNRLFAKKMKERKKRKWTRIIRFAILPVMLLVFFFIIYSFGNNELNKFASNFFYHITHAMEWIINNFTWGRLWLLLLGLMVSSALLIKAGTGYFSRKDMAHEDDLKRKRISWAVRSHHPLYNLIQTFMGRLANGMMALKNENTTGLISLGLLNALLLLVNLLDVNYIWLNYDPSREIVMYKMVHEGTWVLIFSIVMAMIVVLFFFKGNLNFYKKNKLLKYGAYLWIIQNSFLVASVFMRDYYYIQRHGLAYKRLGVLFFLLMVVIGLISVIVKVNNRKTIYYLLRVNASAALVVLVLASTIHWDELIAGYNLARKDKLDLDVPFLLSLSDKTIPLLEKNIDFLQALENKAPAKMERDFYSAGSCGSCYVEQLKYKEKQFLKNQSAYSWLSWNYADSYVKRYLAYLPTSH
ncbi:MAG: DUF4173 domain-containing protein [Chitinophagaceae bacterium]|nr:DUF4173 domain-containing protein [Chitinophagaceae bacterium]